MAISDYLEIIANPIGTFRFDEQDLDAALQETLKSCQRMIKKIVLGYPKTGWNFRILI